MLQKNKIKDQLCNFAKEIIKKRKTKEIKRISCLSLHQNLHQSSSFSHSSSLNLLPFFSRILATISSISLSSSPNILLLFYHLISLFRHDRHLLLWKKLNESIVYREKASLSTSAPKSA
jgi:hypothetical protein